MEDLTNQHSDGGTRPDQGPWAEPLTQTRGPDVRILDTEYELSEILVGASVSALEQPGANAVAKRSATWPPTGERRSFLEEGLDRFLDRLPERIEWWQREAARATLAGTVGRQLFDLYISALKHLDENAQVLRRLPFEERFEEAAVALTFGDRIPMSRPPQDAPWHEESDFLQDLLQATDRVTRLIAIDAWGAEAFLPYRKALDRKQ
jgi:hypothetical protein